MVSTQLIRTDHRERPIGSIQWRLYLENIEDCVDGSIDLELGLLPILAAVSDYKAKVFPLKYFI